MPSADELAWELSGLHERLRKVVADLEPGILDRAPAEGANSIAVLVTHAIGAEMGWLHLAAGRAHQRERASEFAVSGRNAEELTGVVDAADASAKELIAAAIAAGPETLRERPNARPVTAMFCVAHAIAHTAEHVGHAELTRQVLSAGERSA